MRNLLTPLFLSASVAIAAEQESTQTPSSSLHTEANTASYEIQIEEQAALLGPFDSSLVELYQQQGEQLAKQGNYREAISALSQALQISRVNHGPYARQQEPALRSLIDATEASGESVHIELLSKRLLDLNNHTLNGNESIEDLGLLLNSSSWHLNRYINLRSATTLPHLQMAVRLANSAEKLLSNHHSPEHIAVIDALELVARGNFYLTAHYLNDLRFFFSQRQSSLHEQLTEKVFQDGLAAHRRMIKIHQSNNATAGQIASAQIELGDYLQRFQLTNVSHKVYKNAWQTLHQANNEDLLASWLGQPVPLLESNLSATGNAPLARIKAQVSVNGKAEKVEILGDPATQSPELASAAETALQKVVFRTAVIDGEVVPGMVEFDLPIKEPAAHPQSLHRQE
ncbi:hypothetical protein KFE80_06855 [bacterium SCSIO 12696]|nr:hypothetical protein KFE80_06855 [bacterium SCSIO 12696]